MYRIAPLLVLTAWSTAAQSNCPAVNLLTARSVNLKPTTTSHIDLVRQTDGSYTSFEVADAAPYRTIAVTPHFEKQFATCLPHTIPVPAKSTPLANPVGAGSQPTVSTSFASGKVFIANADGATIHFDLLDSQHNLLSENNFRYLDSGQTVYESFESLTLADVNNDGALDLVAVFAAPYADSYQQGGVWVFLGNGDGAFQSGKQQNLMIRGGHLLPVQSVAVADLNGDGKADLLLTAPFGGTVSVALGNGDGTFSPQLIGVSVSLNLNGAPSAALADLNGDGKADLIIAPAQVTSNAATIAVALGNGDGTFQAATMFSVQAFNANPAAVAIGDMNGDGFPDIVTSSGSILLGDGKGNFPARHDYASTASGSVVLADFDGDGKLDIILGNGSPATLSGSTAYPTATVFFGDGNGSVLAAPVSGVTLPLTNYQVFAAADFNGDGSPDLALVTSATNAIQVTTLLGQGNGQFATGPATQPLNIGLPLSAVSADFNHDGKPDLAVLITSGANQVLLYLGKGDGSFAAPLTLAVNTVSAGYITAVDINGDGIPDLAVTSLNAVSIWLGKGDGAFPTAPIVFTGSSPAAAFGDFNGDGKIDVALANAGASNVTVYFGKGDGAFPNYAVFTLPDQAFGNTQNIQALGLNTMAAADFNGDGALDLAVQIGAIVPDAFPNGNFQIAVLLGTGTGTFAPPILSAGLFTSPVAADINRDGLPDLVGEINVGFSGGGLGVALANGDGTFQPAVPIESLSQFVVADFNRDGVPDIAGLSSSGIPVFLNLAQPAVPLVVVSAASFQLGPFAPNTLVSAFGRNLAPFAESATGQPDQLAGTSVSVTDSTGATIPAQLLFVSPDQVNFLVPPGIANGTASVRVSSSNTSLPLTAPIQITALAPSLFLAVPDTGGYFSLYGTGFDAATAAMTSVTVQGLPVTITYVGPQHIYPGLDQINILVPAALLGGGLATVVVTIGGQTANPIYITI